MNIRALELLLLFAALSLAFIAGGLWELGCREHSAMLGLCASVLILTVWSVQGMPSASTFFPPDFNAKPSTCCPGELLVPMHSTDTKLCTGCKTERHWPLEPGQKRTFD